MPKPNLTRRTLAFNDSAVREAMAKQGNTISISNPEFAAQLFKSELAKYTKLVKKTVIEAQ